MHAAVTHYHHDGVMTAIGDVAEEDLPWKGSSSKLVEPAMPKAAAPVQLKFRDWAMPGMQVNQNCIHLEATLQVGDGTHVE